MIHNAEFDLAFLNAELARLERDPIGCRFVDTLGLARVRFPGAPASLDALCRRFDIDLSLRVEHGAEIDCGLLAAVYLELLGGRQPGLDFVAPHELAIAGERILRAPRPHEPSAEELIAHQAMLQMHHEPDLADRRPEVLTPPRLPGAAALSVGLLAAQQLGEVDRVDHQRRKPAVTGRVGDDRRGRTERRSAASPPGSAAPASPAARS